MAALAAGDTLGISQVEAVGSRMLLKRAHELVAVQGPMARPSLGRGPAQLLALSKPGVYSKDREQAYFDARFADRDRPAFPHPPMATVLDDNAWSGPRGSAGRARQLLGFDHGWAERFRRALSGGRAGGATSWSGPSAKPARAALDQRTVQCLARAGVAARGLPAPTATRSPWLRMCFEQACAESESRDRGGPSLPDVLNNGGSLSTALAAVEEARRFGVRPPPCVDI